MAFENDELMFETDEELQRRQTPTGQIAPEKYLLDPQEDSSIPSNQKTLPVPPPVKKNRGSTHFKLYHSASGLYNSSAKKPIKIKNSAKKGEEDDLLFDFDDNSFENKTPTHEDTANIQTKSPNSSSKQPFILNPYRLKFSNPQKEEELLGTSPYQLDNQYGKTV